MVREKIRSPGFVIVLSAGKCEDVFATELSDPVRYSKHKKCSPVSFTKERIETLMSITNRLSESKHGQGAREKMPRRKFTSPRTRPINPSAPGCQGLSPCTRCSLMDGFICPIRQIEIVLLLAPHIVETEL